MSELIPEHRNDFERLLDRHREEVERYLDPANIDRGRGALHELIRHVLHEIRDRDDDLRRELTIEDHLCDDCPGRRLRRSGASSSGKPQAATPSTPPSSQASSWPRAEDTPPPDRDPEPTD